MNKTTMTILTALALATALGVAGCSKGKTGSPCAKPGDCKHGYFCETGKCKAGPETACGYIARCLPLMEQGQAETLFGVRNTGFRAMLKRSPSEAACDSKLKVLAAMNRRVALARACGPWVTKAP